MKSALLGLLLAALVACASSRPAPPSNPGDATSEHDLDWNPRRYACARFVTPPEIDGRLTDPCWATAPWTEAFVDIRGGDRPGPRLLTRAKMGWDDTHFYIAAELEEPHVWGTLTERDSVIFRDNDFEVFIDPDGDSHTYFELEINALGTEWDLLLVRPYRDGGPAVHAWDIPGLREGPAERGPLSGEDRRAPPAPRSSESHGPHGRRTQRRRGHMCRSGNDHDRRTGTLVP